MKNNKIIKTQLMTCLEYCDKNNIDYHKRCEYCENNWFMSCKKPMCEKAKAKVDGKYQFFVKCKK